MKNNEYKTVVVAIGLSMMLFGCGKVETNVEVLPEDIAVVEQMEVLVEDLEEVEGETTVDELATAELSEAEISTREDSTNEEVVEQVDEFENIIKMFTIGKADVMNKADETSERLATVDENYEVEVVGTEGEFSEVRWLEGTGYVKTVLLSEEKIEDFANWEAKEEEVVEKEEIPAEVIEEAKSTNDVTIVEEVAPSPVSDSNSAEQKRQADIAKLAALGYGNVTFTEGHDYGTYGEVTKDIVLH